MKAHLLALMLVIGIASGCTKDKDSDNEVYGQAPVIAVEVPSPAQVNKPINFNITVAYPNGCVSFRRFIETMQIKVRSVAVETTIPKDKSCAEVVVNRTSTYTYTPTEKGSYTFKFKNYDSWIEKVVTVE